MLKYNGHILNVGGGTIKYTYVPPTYTVTCIATHGSVTATPSQGLSGTLITLSNTPDSGYELDYYTVNGVTLVGNTFTLTEDVTVECVFKEYVDPLVAVVGTQKWMVKDLDVTDGGREIYLYNGHYYYSNSSANRIINAYYPGWRLPTVDDVNTLYAYVGNSNTPKLLREDQLWSAGVYCTNEYGTSFTMPSGRVYYNYSKGTYSWENSSQGYYRTSTSTASKKYDGYKILNNGNYDDIYTSANALDDSRSNKYLYKVHLIKD